MPNLGEKIDEFRLVESIGAGGMGAVFRAVDLGLDRQVALKILPPDQALDPEVVRRYHQEGRAAARLDHENIARVYTIGDDGRYHYIAFEFIDGVTIRQKVAREGPLSVADAIHFTLQIARALIHAAEREVVHRDIKPSNIIVTSGGRAKLVDMGLARHFERRGEADLTQTGMTLGTFDYISPEQAQDPRNVDIRGDLYSLGCTLFHMLSGRPPFPDGTVLQKLIQHREEAPPDIRRLNPSVPDSLATILTKLLVKDREHRYQTPEHLAHDLGTVSTRRVRATAIPSTRVTPNWARHLFWGGPGLIFLLVLGGMVWWGDGPAPKPPLAGGQRNQPMAGPPGADVGSPPLSLGPLGGRPGNPGTGSGPLKPDPLLVPDSISPREVAVSPSDDLARILAEAPPRSTIVLVERGPYELRGDRPIRLDRSDLTIRAEVGIRPVIRLTRDSTSTGNASNPGGIPTPLIAALVEIRGGRVTFDGLDFLIDPSSLETTFGSDRPGSTPLSGTGARILTAISAEDAEVVVRRCSFRRVSGSALGSGLGTAPGAWRTAAIRFQGVPRTGSARGTTDNLTATLVVDASDFEGHQVGLLMTGPVDVALRDVAFGPTLSDQASLWSDNLEGGATPSEIRLDHVSGLLEAGPMFRFSGTSPRVLARHSVFGPVPATGPLETAPSATLVVIDVPDRLDWRGSDNLYSRIGVFLRPGGARPQAPIRTFDLWSDDPGAFRESGSVAFDGAVWERLPITSLTPTSAEAPRSFRLLLPRPVVHHPGARWGPTGPLPPPVPLASLAATNRTISADRSGLDRSSLPAVPVPSPLLPLPATPLVVPGLKRGVPGPESSEPPIEERPEVLTPMPMPTPADPDRSAGSSW